MSNDLIVTKGLCKYYSTGDARVVALEDVSLTVPTGDFVAIMGPSGSGKSTFMNMVGCLDVPTKGTYTLEGLPIDELSADELALVRCTKIGFVFQNFNLIARTTALANVEMPRYYSFRGFKDRAEAARKRLAEVGLADRAKHVPSEMSGGQQQRVAIARALVNDPSLILADEPTGALDSHSTIEIMAIFQRLNQEGKTVIVVTHEQEVANHCKRIVRFLDGRVVSDEPVIDPVDAAKTLAAQGAVAPISGT